MWRKILDLISGSTDEVETKEPQVIGYAAVIMTSRRKLVLGQPCGSDGWAATACFAIREGESELAKVLACLGKVWSLDRPPIVSWSGRNSAWRANDRLTKVSWWFADVGGMKEFPGVDGFASIQSHDPYQLLDRSVPRANSAVPRIPLSLVQDFVTHRDGRGRSPALPYRSVVIRPQSA